MLNASTGSVIKERLNSAPGFRVEPGTTYECWSSRTGDSPGTPTAYPMTGETYSREYIAYDSGSAYFKNVVHEVEIRQAKTVGFRGEFHLHDKTAPSHYVRWAWPLTAMNLHSTSLIPGHPSGGLAMPTINLNNLDGALAQAHRDMVPRVEDIAGGVNFVNFLLELKDVKQMFTLWKSSMGALKNLSAGILNLEYAWKPMINDLVAVSRGLANLQKYLDRWNRDARAGVIYTRHADITHMVWDDGSYSDSTTSAWTNPYLFDWKRRYLTSVGYSEEVRVIAHLAFKPKAIPSTGINKLMATFDAIGIGDPLSIIWEAIPFSFLVDYFLSVGKFLSQFDHDFYLAPIEYVDFGYSVKSDATYTFSNRYEYSSPTYGTEEVSAPEAFYRIKRYIRRRIGPPPLEGEATRSVNFGMLELKRPDFRQAFLMVNLLNVLRR